MAERVDGDVAGARAMTIAIIGIAHVILTVSWFDLARAFYGKSPMSSPAASRVSPAY
jgi:hypothetical protein